MENLAHLQEEVQRLRDFRHHAENKIGALEVLYNTVKLNCTDCKNGEQLLALRKRIDDISSILIGSDGANGLRGTVREHKSWIDNFDARLDKNTEQLTLINYQLSQIMWGLKIVGGLSITALIGAVLKLVLIP